MVKDIKSLAKILKTISEFSRVAESKLDVEKKEYMKRLLYDCKIVKPVR